MVKECCLFSTIQKRIIGGKNTNSEAAFSPTLLTYAYHAGFPACVSISFILPSYECLKLQLNIRSFEWLQSRRHLKAIPGYGREKGLACLLQQWKEFTGMLEKSQISLSHSTTCIGVQDVMIDAAYASQLHSFLFLNKIYFSSKTEILKQT